MSEFLSGWITAVTAAAILSAVALTVTPDGGVKKVTQLVCGLVLTLTALTPVLSLRLQDVQLTLPEPQEDRAYTKRVEAGQSVLKQLIQERTGAYIESKAQALGLDAGVICEAEETEAGLFVPVSVKITAASPLSEELRQTFSAWIAAECGIPAGRQQFVVLSG